MPTNLHRWQEATALIFDAIRTPRGKGKADGALHTIKPIDLVVGLLEAAARAATSASIPARIEDLCSASVTPIGDQGMDIRETAAIKAGLPDACRPPGEPLLRVGLEAVNLAAAEGRFGRRSSCCRWRRSMSRVPDRLRRRRLGN